MRLRDLVRSYIREVIIETYGSPGSIGTDPRDPKGPYSYDLPRGSPDDLRAKSGPDPMRPSDPDSYIRGPNKTGTFTGPDDPTTYVGMSKQKTGGSEPEPVEESDESVEEVSPGGAHTLGGW